MGLRIYQVLEEKGVSVAELGRRMNKSRATMHATLEKGNPQYTTLVEIAEALGIPITELFDNSSDDVVIGIIRHNGKSYEVNSIEDLEKIIENIKSVH